jgi:hypothetical protein
MNTEYYIRNKKGRAGQKYYDRYGYKDINVDYKRTEERKMQRKLEYYFNVKKINEKVSDFGK